MTPLSFSIEMAFLETKLLSTRKIVLMLTISTVMSTHRDGAVGFFFFKEFFGEYSLPEIRSYIKYLMLLFNALPDIEEECCINGV